MRSRLLCFRAVENARVRGLVKNDRIEHRSALAPEESIRSINGSVEILTCQGSMILVEWLGSLGSQTNVDRRLSFGRAASTRRAVP